MRNCAAGSLDCLNNSPLPDTVARLLGEDRPLRFTTLEKKGFFSKLFGG